MWYEDKQQYTSAEALPREILQEPHLSLVHANSDGTTTKGWGRENYMRNYRAGKFLPDKYLKRYEAGRAFGIIMRSVPLLSVDIDGKNGGFQSSRVLKLDHTKGETSKSGNGVHLFYSVEDEWHRKYGFDRVSDALGIVPGVDVRGTGIIYHYPQQRWNNEPISPAPRGLLHLLEARRRTQDLAKEKTLRQRNLDEEERAILESELLELLKKPIPSGRRNNTLYAWGCKADGIVKNWPLHLHFRGEQVGLSSDELVQIINSVKKYGSGE